MPVIDVRVRLPGAKDPEIVSIEPDLTSKEAIGVIAEQLGAGNLAHSHLVIAPNDLRNGSIISPLTKIADLSFNPKEDVLELWKQPVMTSICIYFKENGRDNVRDRKVVPLDSGSLLLQMIPTLQRVLDLGTQPFSIQYTESIDADGRVGKTRWLHCSTPLEDQDVDATKGNLLCHPVSKLLKVPEQTLRPIVKGWMWKRSMKGDRISSKQRRLFVLSDAFLFYFKKERDSSAAGVIPLDYYIVTRKIQLKKKKYAMLLTLSNEPWPGMTSKFKLQAETADGLEHWVEHIKTKCMNAGNQRVFGVDIKEVTSRKSNQSRFIPAVVKECISFVHNNALDSVGIFRLSACSSTVEYYKDQFDTGQSVNFSDAMDNNVPAALLKCYLRELPEPLFTFGLFDKFEELFSLPKEDRNRQIGAIFAEFPIENYATTKFLFKFLSIVARHEENNKMGPTNLATVFGPNLLSSPEGNSVRAFGIVNGLTENIIVAQEEIFQFAEELNPSFKQITLPSLGEKAASLKFGASWASIPRRGATPLNMGNRSSSDIGIGVREQKSPRRENSPLGLGRGGPANRRGAPPRPNRPGRGRPTSFSIDTAPPKNLDLTSPPPPSANPHRKTSNPRNFRTKANSDPKIGELMEQLRVEREQRVKLEAQVAKLTARIKELERGQH